jgi:hypothetical protein
LNEQYGHSRWQNGTCAYRQQVAAVVRRGRQLAGAVGLEAQLLAAKSAQAAGQQSLGDHGVATRSASFATQRITIADLRNIMAERSWNSQLPIGSDIMAPFGGARPRMSTASDHTGDRFPGRSGEFRQLCGPGPDV